MDNLLIVLSASHMPHLSPLYPLLWFFNQPSFVSKSSSYLEPAPPLSSLRSSLRREGGEGTVGQEKKEQRNRKKVKWEWAVRDCGSQPHRSDEVWGLSVSEATPPPCSPNEYYLPLHSGVGTSVAAHTMPCCQGRGGEGSPLRIMCGRRPRGKNRQLFGRWWCMCLNMQQRYEHSGQIVRLLWTLEVSWSWSFFYIGRNRADYYFFIIDMLSMRQVTIASFRRKCCSGQSLVAFVICEQQTPENVRR